VNCPNCETYNQASANYCSNCGRQLATPDDTQREDSGSGEGPTQFPPDTGQEISLSESTEYAGVGIRAVAYAIDVFLVNVMGLFILRILTGIFGPTEFLIYVVYVATIGYMILFTGLRGQTPGKMVMGLHVVRPGRPVPGIGPALARELLGRPLSLLSLGLGYASASWDPRKQTWHDKLAGTYVIRTRTGIFTPPRSPNDEQ
jgi:uncharacterized RDD family membrane protein YckC